jgi:NDP-sugar pyrophosphorylase family protein
MGIAEIPAVLLSAGLGLRLRPLSNLRPKPLFPVLGRTQLSFWLDKLEAAGIAKAAVNAFHLRPMLARALEAERARRPGFEISLSLETELLGTGGGIKKAAEAFKGFEGPILVANSDIRTDLDLEALFETHLALGRPPATLALVDEPAKATVSLGAGGEILGFRSPGPLPGEARRLCGTGVMVLEEGVLRAGPFGPFDIIELLALFFSGSHPAGLRPKKPAAAILPMTLWRDMGSFQDYLSLNKLLAGGRRFWGAPGLAGAEGDAAIEGDAASEGDAAIEGDAPPWPDVEIEGFIFAEKGAEVGQGSKLKDCVLWREARVGPGASLIDCVAAGEVPAGAALQGLAIAPGKMASSP